MLVVNMELMSARGAEHDRRLGTIIIDNIGGTHARGNYRVRAYRKGHSFKKHGYGNPIREGEVHNHARLAEPVWNLMAKALAALGYK